MSDFEQLQIPAIKDAQDYVRLVPANSVVEIPVVGDFIYCKFSDGEVKVTISGKAIRMQAGDERKSGSVFRGVILENDTDVDKAVVFVIGFGEFDRKIVTGEISITPVLRGSDGQIREDTRESLAIYLTPEKLETTTYNRGDVVIYRGQYDVPGRTFADDAQHIFAGPGGFPVFSYLYSGFSEGSWRQLDFDINIIEENLTQILSYVGGAIASDVGWSPTHAFMASRLKNLYRVNPNSSTSVIYQTEMSEITSFCYIPDRNSILLLDSKTGQLEEINESDLTLIRKLNGGPVFSGATPIRYDWTFGKIYAAYNNDRYVEYDIETDTTSAAITGIDTNDTLATTRGLVIRGDSYISQRNNSNNTGPFKVALNDFTTSPEFQGVRPDCALYASLFVPENLPQISANIQITELTTGIAFSGEVIKGALEFFFKRAVPDDYLDHIYFADLGKDRTGLPIKPISTGNTTFAALGISDNFEIITPGTINLLIDSELQLGAAL